MTQLLTDDEGFTLGRRSSRDSMHWSPEPPPCDVPPEAIAAMYDPPLVLERGMLPEADETYLGTWCSGGSTDLVQVDDPSELPPAGQVKRRPTWLSLLLWPLGMLGRRQ